MGSQSKGKHNKKSLQTKSKTKQNPSRANEWQRPILGEFGYGLFLMGSNSGMKQVAFKTHSKITLTVQV